ncbi:MAG: branched-chain amino acid ABC transporter permease, partial [Planctomycetota bacterium]|nr:branched-chain amino acid ABC transporter permease [Planctomycetota bacterium]
MDTTVLFQALVSGLLFGGVFALAAVGLTLIFGVLKIINFAHGEFVMLGMYLSYFA